MNEEKNIEKSSKPQALSDKQGSPYGAQDLTTDQQNATEDMETHAHHLHNVPGKNFWHYFFEFFMLFLAVFCGFLAENFRESIVEHEREKQYILSFIADLKSDTAAITGNLKSKLQKKEIKDSLIWYLNASDPNQYGQRIYFLARQLTRTTNFFPADGTIKQLKNSGGLRLIRQPASDSIEAYDQAIERFQLSQNRQEGELNDIRPMMGRLMNANILETMIDGEEIHPPVGNPPLRTPNKEFLLDFIYAIHQLKGSDEVSGSQLQKLREKATATIQFLKKEYSLK
jgi:hypothetical protein